MTRPIVLAAAGLMLLVGLAPTSSADDKVVLESKDGRSELELPPGWQRLEMAGVQIAATNPTKRLYLEVITEDRRDFDGDLQKYAALRRETFAKMLGDVSWARGRSITVSGNPAWRYEGHGTRGQSKAGFLLTIVQIGNDYHTVWTWCGQSHFDADKKELEKIPQGLRSSGGTKRAEHLQDL